MNGGCGVGGVNLLLYSYFVSVHKRDPSPKYKTKIMCLVCPLKEDRKMGIGLSMKFFFFLVCLKWLLKSVAKNKILMCCPKLHGFVQLLVGQLLL